jgi:hypothetical protein
MPARLVLVLLAAATFTATATPAEEPLHVRIDRMIEAKAENAPLSWPADDAEFLRRAWLDFAGRVPPADATRAFLADADPEKRAKVLDRLFAGPDYAPRLADAFHVMLMERLGDSPEWTAYLVAAFQKNKPWDQMAREMLRADPKDEANRGASFFLAKRLENYGQNPVEYSALTRDVGRLFLGKNLQCCECHDHLFITDYKQKDFQGLHAFFKNTRLVNAAKMQVGENPTTEKTSFASVFDKVMMSTGPSLPGGTMIEIPTFPKGMEFAEPPDRKTNSPGVPKFSTLAAVSEQLPRATNRDFTRNIANRLWFLAMGRGLVHPLDLHHSANVGQHPQLMDLLADEFAAHKFDVKWFLRELARTKVYQRSSRAPDGLKPGDAWFFGTALEKRLTAEQQLQSVLEATGERDRVLKETSVLVPLRAKFLKAYASQPREPETEVEPSLKAALFVSHDAAVLDLLRPRPGNLVDRLTKLPDDQAAAELYAAVLSRTPTADEVDTVVKILKKNPDRKADAAGRLAWALLASMEFGVNH